MRRQECYALLLQTQSYPLLEHRATTTFYTSLITFLHAKLYMFTSIFNLHISAQLIRFGFFSDDIQRFIALLDEDATLLNSTHDDLHCSVLMRSLFVKNGEAFTKTLLTYDVNIHQKDIYGNSPLHV